MMMKKLVIGAFAASMAGAAVLGAANADDDLVAQCEAAMAADGRDGSGCACLVEAVGDDDALSAEFATLGEIADAAERYAAASDEAKAVMDKCTR